MPKTKRYRYDSEQSALQNAAKTLLANIRFANVDKPIRSIVVTSSVPVEGKSVVSINLAQAITSSGKTVLIMECDMRKRSLYRALHAHASAGLYAVLTEQIPLEQAVLATQWQGMYFLDAEPSIPNPADIVASKRFSKFLDVLMDTYDYVILDTPPVGTFIDAAILSTLADGTVFVVREDYAKRSDILNAYEQLKKADAEVIGVVLNYCQDHGSHSGYYYYDYYSKGGSGDRAYANTVATSPQKSSSHHHHSSSSGHSTSNSARRR